MREHRNIGFTEYCNQIKDVCKRRNSKYALMNLMDNGEVLRLRHSALYRYIEQFAEVKKEYGLKDGDRVLVLEPVIMDAFLSFVVLSCNHLTVVIGDAGLPKEELSSLIDETEISAIFTDKERLPLVKDRLDVPIFRTYGMNSKLSLIQAPETEHPDYSKTPDSVAIIFSSGTTSKMKPIEITYKSLVLSADVLYEKMKYRRDRMEDSSMLMVYPMSHMAGLSCSSALLLKGITMSSVESVNSTSLVKGLKTFNPIIFGMVAKVLAIFIDKLNEELKKKHLYGAYSKLRKISAFFRNQFGIWGVGRAIMLPFRKALFGKELCYIPSGGSPCIPEVSSAILDLGVSVINSYAATECGNPVFSTDYRDRSHYESVGTAKHNPDVRIKINNPDENGIGEIYVKSRYMMKGYYGDPIRTAEAFDNGFFKTGDLGFFDKDKYLHVVGRSKDSILLPSGKKVAPDDLEGMLLNVIGVERTFSVVGVPVGSTGFDSINVFIEDNGSSAKENADLEKKIYSWQRKEAPYYPIKKIHFISEFPKTSVGKIKRNELRKMALSKQSIPASDYEGKLSKDKNSHINDTMDDQNIESSNNTNQKSDSPEIAKINYEFGESEDILTCINEMVMRCTDIKTPLSGTEDLENDLGIDSLSMMMICTEIEEQYGVYIGEKAKTLRTTSEIAAYIRNPMTVDERDNSSSTKTGDLSKNTEFNAFEYPLKRKPIHEAVFRILAQWSYKNIDFEINGLNNVKKGEPYIFCPNHQTHFDGLWTWMALGKKCPPLDQIGCMSKMEHLENKKSRLLMTVLGGIPVDREGNTMTSFKRSIDFIREGNSFLIHPEGTRTRTGKLGELKDGAALMASEADVNIIPVAIDGGFEVWPYNEKSPKTKDPATGRKCKVKITFCKPVSPEGRTPEEIMETVRAEIAGELGE